MGSSADVEMDKALENNEEAVRGGGALSSTGEVVIKPDVRRAIQLFDRSSQLGYPQATMNLGQIYRHGYKDNSGNVIEKDVQKAVEVFSRHAGGIDASGCSVNGFPPVAEQLKEILTEQGKSQ